MTDQRLKTELSLDNVIIKIFCTAHQLHTLERIKVKTAPGTDRPTYRHTDGRTDGQTEGRTDSERWMDR